MIIGLGYRARSGKDTAASWLCAKHNFRRIAFADSLKAAAQEIFKLTHEQMYGDLKEVLDIRWNMTPREILQKFGTEALRNHFDQDIWLKSCKMGMEQYPDADWVIPDVRFPNEARAIRRWGGFVVEVVRPDLPSISTVGHASETAMADFAEWDDTLPNSGTLTDLYEATDELRARLLVREAHQRLKDAPY